MPSFLAAVSHSLALLSFLGSMPVVSAGSSCVAMDINWNLLVFGYGGKDYNAGTKDSWASGALGVLIDVLRVLTGNRL